MFLLTIWKTIANLSALSQFLEKILSSCTKLAKQFGSAGFTLTKGAMKLMSLPFYAEYKKFTERWLEEHPEEKEKMAKSKAEWQANFDSQFKIVAKIASDHNATITWCGTNNAERGDQWMVSQNNEQLGVFTV